MNKVILMGRLVRNPEVCYCGGAVFRRREEERRGQACGQ